MASPVIPLFDPDETARLLRNALAQHAETFGGRLDTPAEGPMFRAAPDGAILHRDGTVVQPPPPTSPTQVPR